MYNPKNPKDNALHLLCLFLAEEMRMRMLSLGEAKEIARTVVLHINLIDNEEHLLKMMVEMGKDYPQLRKFEQKLANYIVRQSRTDAERKVTEFVQSVMDSDSNLALSILDEAINSNNSLDVLMQKYPRFAEFINNNK